MKPKGTTVHDKIIGNNIRTRRLELHMSGATLGAKLNVTFQQIQKYERGQTRIPASRLAVIAKALGVNITQLMGSGNELAEVSPIAAFSATKNGHDIMEAMVALPPTIQRALIEFVRALGGSSVPA